MGQVNPGYLIDTEESFIVGSYFTITDQTDFDAPDFTLNVFSDVIGTGETLELEYSITDESDIIAFELFISTDSFNTVQSLAVLEDTSTFYFYNARKCCF